MAKTRSIFICQNCGAEASKWIGRCPACDQWNTYVEEIVQKSLNSGNSIAAPMSSSKPHPIGEISSNTKKRIDTKIGELNRILGGGLVPGSVVLLGGEPGIGKSTIALQVALASDHLKVLYVSGEESEQQIRLRADRLQVQNPQCLVYSETVLENILYAIEEQKPDLLVIDSIQTLYSSNLESSPGTVAQIKECTASLLRVAKKRDMPAILIGHINKEGNIAGPKVLEHIVDTVIQFEGDMNNLYRLLRVAKNRFGATSELAIFEMVDKGLREVTNPSQVLINQSHEQFSGIAIAATIDGLRPFLIEIQALVSSAVYGTPQRSCTGFDYRRLNMLLAVLEKKVGFHLAMKDVFLNIAGGLKINDPAIDMAVMTAILSSFRDECISNKYCFAAEVGLTGEIRPVNRIAQRIRETEKLGFEKMFVSAYDKKNCAQASKNIQIVYVSRIEELHCILFGSR